MKKWLKRHVFAVYETRRIVELEARIKRERITSPAALAQFEFTKPKMGSVTLVKDDSLTTGSDDREEAVPVVVWMAKGHTMRLWRGKSMIQEVKRTK